jgi:ATP-dependent 26S proteasome regulatory subunit
MSSANLDARRAANLWEAYARKLAPIAKSCRFVAEPSLSMEQIGGLEAAKEEILTYACAATHPSVYAHWGTVPPGGLLLIGPPGSGKSLLAETLATQAGTPFLAVNVPRLIRQVLHVPGIAGDLVSGWTETLGEMPRTTVFFGELDLSSSWAPAGQPAGPAGPFVDFLVELIERTIAVEPTLLVGSSSRPEALPPEFIEPGRFERIVEVVPIVPDDVVAALEIHAAQAEARAARKLFRDVDWKSVVDLAPNISIGEWIRTLHAALRRKARCEAAGEVSALLTTDDLRAEGERSTHARRKLPPPPGSYL